MNEKEVNVNVNEILKTIKNFRDKYYAKGTNAWDAINDIVCLLVEVYLYRGW